MTRLIAGKTYALVPNIIIHWELVRPLHILAGKLKASDAYVNVPFVSLSHCIASKEPDVQDAYLSRTSKPHQIRLISSRSVQNPVERMIIMGCLHALNAATYDWAGTSDWHC